jgi:hypothetical protein
MDDKESASHLYDRLASVDPLSSELMPAGWSRRNWVQRERVALDALGRDKTNNREELA